MIKIIDKHKCCGCEACAQRCSKQCITMIPDDEGFLYPQVDEAACINCGVCEKVCPVINQGNSMKPLGVFAAINPHDNIREKSSSGGVFTAIAEKVIMEGGVVFGARFNESWEVEHYYIEHVEDLEKLRGSKYVQSRIRTAYQKVESFLNERRSVLFSGTSCQVAGLKRYLRKEYDGLLTVDVVCHGVPSPKLWKDYLSTLEDLYPIKAINMKDKTEGWMSYKITIQGDKASLSERASDNKFMLAFSQNLSLRPSCYQCPAKAGKSGSDITLADYWGVEKLFPKMYDNKGTSFVCANTQKGQAFFKALSLNKEMVKYDASVPYNACIVTSSAEPARRVAFWVQYQEYGVKVLETLKPKRTNIIKRALSLLKRIIK